MRIRCRPTFGRIQTAFQKHREMTWRALDDVDGMTDEVVEKQRPVALDTCFGDVERIAEGRAGKDLMHRDVEDVRGHERFAQGLAPTLEERFGDRRDQVGQGAMLDHHPLGLTRRAGRIDDIGQILGPR